MKIIRTLKELIVFRSQMLKQTLSFVPTMGALHEGHLALVEKAQENSEKVLVSLFVNPSQFTNEDDFNTYPNTIEPDCARLEKLGVDAVFIPEVSEFYDREKYPEWYIWKDDVHLPELFSLSEGAARDGHFEGVFQVLYRFFGYINPDVVVFGQKDFQQTLLVQHLVSQFFPHIQVIIHPIVREKSGLALSSRNIRLSSQSRESAKELHESLHEAQALFSSGEKNAKALLEKVVSYLVHSQYIEKVYYIEIRDSVSFVKKIDEIKTGDVMLLSLEYDGVHLVDNHIFV